MKTIINLIKYDLIMILNAKKHKAVFTMIFVILVSFAAVASGGFTAGILFLIVAVIPPTLLFETEKSNDCEKTMGIIPVSRRDVVIARFAGTTAFLTAIFIIMGIILEVMNSFESDDSNFNEAILSLFRLDPEKISFASFSRLSFCSFFLVSMFVMTKMLRKHMKNGTKAKKHSMALSFVKMYLLIEAIGFGITVLLTLDVPIVKAVLAIIASITGALIQPLGGLILCSVLIIIAYGTAAYNCVSAYIEYDKREL